MQDTRLNVDVLHSVASCAQGSFTSSKLAEVRSVCVLQAKQRQAAAGAQREAAAAAA